MKKKIIFIKGIASAASLFLLLSNISSIRSSNPTLIEPDFKVIESTEAEDEVFGDGLVSSSIDLRGNIATRKLTNNGNNNKDESLTKPKIGFQMAHNDTNGDGINDTVSIRYTAAIASLDVEATWTRAMYDEHGNCFSKVVEADKSVVKAYTGLANGKDENNQPKISYPADLVDEFGNHPYRYYVVYTLLNIPIGSLGSYFLDASLTLRKGGECVTSSVGAVEVNSKANNNANNFSYERGTNNELVFTEKTNNGSGADKTLKVKGKDKNTTEEEIVIPGYYNNGNGRYKVDEVEDNAFKDFTNTEYIEIPDVDYMGSDIANGSPATLLSRSGNGKDNGNQSWHRDWNNGHKFSFEYAGYHGSENGVEYALLYKKQGKQYALTVVGYNNELGTNVTLGEYQGLPVITISPYAFYGSGVVNVNLGNSMAEIGHHAFFNVRTLSTIELGPIVNIGASAFKNCMKLKSCTYTGDYLSTIGSEAFYKCTYLAYFDVEGAYEIQSSAFAYSGIHFLSFSSVAIIDDGAFDHFQGTIVLPFASEGSLSNSWSKNMCNTPLETVIRYIPSARTVSVDNVLYLIVDNYTYGECASEWNEPCAIAVSAVYASTMLEIPEKVTYGTKSYPVVAIGPSAFKGNKDAYYVEIPATVIEINDYAFENCKGLESVAGAQGLHRVGERAFYGCDFLFDFDFTGKDLTTIESEAFKNCDRLYEVIFTKNAALSYVGAEAFYGSIQGNVYLPGSVTTIGSKAFDHTFFCCAVYTDATKNPAGWASDWNGDTRVYYGSSDMTFSQEYIEVGGYKLYSEDGTYDACWIIGFAYADRFSNGVLMSPDMFMKDAEYNPEEHDYSNTSDSELYYQIVGIAPYAFAGNVRIKYVDIYNFEYIIILGHHAFYNCPLISYVNVNCIDDISESAFKNCVKLKSFTAYGFASFNYDIGNSAFYGCTSLVNFDVLGNGIWDIGSYAFYDTRVRYFSTNWIYGGIQKDAFTGMHGMIYIDDEAGSDPYMYQGVHIVSPDDDVAIVGHRGEIEDCSEIYKNHCCYVDLTSNDYVFYGLDKYASDSDHVSVSLTNCITNDDGEKPITVVGNSAFAMEDKLETVSLTTAVHDIRSNAFEGCGKLTTITGIDNVTKIGNDSFSGCTSLTTFPFTYDALETIGKNAFKDCENLTNFVIPSGVRTIGSGAFSGINSVTAVYIPSTVTTIESYAFDNIVSNIVIYTDATKDNAGWAYNWNGDYPVHYGATLNNDGSISDAIDFRYL